MSSPYDSESPQGVPAAAPASFGQRALARIIDWVVVGVVTWIISLLPIFATTTQMPVGDTTIPVTGYTFLGWLLVLVIGVGNEVVLPVLKGGQIGKLALGLQLVSADDPTKPIGWVPAILRCLLLGFVFSLCFVPGVLFYLSPLWGGPTVQGWHDKIIKTMVVRKSA